MKRNLLVFFLVGLACLVGVSFSDRATCSGRYATSECLLSHLFPTWTFVDGLSGQAFGNTISQVERDMCENPELAARFFAFESSVRNCVHCSEEVTGLIDRTLIKNPICLLEALRFLSKEERQHLIVHFKSIEDSSLPSKGRDSLNQFKTDPIYSSFVSELLNEQ